jgi:hypothetical protein
MKRLFELRERHPALEALVYPPAGRGHYWTVVVASYTGFSNAMNSAAAARETRVADDAFVIGMRTIESAGRRFVPYAPSVDIRRFPALIGPTPGLVTSDAAHVVVLQRFPDMKAALQASARLEEQFPSLHLTILRNDPEYALIVANYVDVHAASEAVALAHRIGYSTVEDLVVTPGPPSWKTAQDVLAERTRIAEVVTRCYTKELKTTVEQMHSCSGLWITPTLLTQCVLQSGCYAQDTVRDLDHFLKSHGLNRQNQQLVLQQGALLAAGKLSAVKAAVESCRNAANGSQANFEACAARVGMNKENLQTVECVSKVESSNDFAACIAKGLPDDQQRAQITCLQQSRGNDAAILRCFGNTAQARQAAEIKTCVDAARGQTDILGRCVLPTLNERDRVMASCLLKHKGNPLGAVQCAAPPNSPARQFAVVGECVSRSGDDLKRSALCVAQGSGGDAGKIAACLTQTPVTAESAASCAFPNNPDAAKAVRIAKCVSDGADAVTLLSSCADGIVDPKVSRLAGCAAKSGGATDRLAGCAASEFLPPEASRLAACAATSQSATGVAICAAAPMLSEEWRIAAECAVSSGGVPVTFAACTAGRLTVRELTKCFTGQDCFGPNNEIVKAFNTVSNDLQHGLGPNNDIVKAAKGVTDTAAQVKNTIVDGLKQTPVVGPVVTAVEDGCKKIGICR